MTQPPTAPVDVPPRSARLVLRGLVVLPIVVAVLRALFTGWFPVGDSALLAIRAADVGTEHHPLLGSWTSASLTLGEDVNNPGPLYFDLLAPFTWTVGRWFGPGPAIALGVGAVNAGFALLTGWVGTRMGGWRVERWALLLVAALSWSMGSELLIDIWQPHALLLPFACLLMTTATVVDRDWRLLPIWLAVASLLVQTHVGYAYVVIVLAVTVAAAGVATMIRLGIEPRRLVRHRVTAWSAGVLVLAWIQPVVEQFFGDGRGNLQRLVTNAGGGDVVIGPGTATKLVAEVVALPPWWTRPGFDESVVSTPLTPTPDGPVLRVPDLPSAPLAVAAVAAVVAVLVALRWRASRRSASALTVALVGTLTAATTLSVQTVSTVGLGSHHVRWLWVLSLFVHVTIVWAAVELVPRIDARAVTAGVVGVTALLSFANLRFVAHDLGPTADRAAADTLERTFDDLTAFDPDGPVRFDVSDLRPFEPWSAAVMMRLRELGIEFRVADEGVVRQLGPARRSDGSEVTTVRQIERSAALRHEAAGCVLSARSPFDRVEEAEIDRAIAEAAADLAAGEVELRLDGLEAALAERFRAAAAGDDDEAFVLIADGVVAALAADGRIGGTPAIDRVVSDAERVERRVVGALVLVADPPVGCPHPSGAAAGWQDEHGDLVGEQQHLRQVGDDVAR